VWAGSSGADISAGFREVSKGDINTGKFTHHNRANERCEPDIITMGSPAPYIGNTLHASYNE
jgi:hypothetical protein